MSVLVLAKRELNNLGACRWRNAAAGGAKALQRFAHDSASHKSKSYSRDPSTSSKGLRILVIRSETRLHWLEASSFAFRHDGPA